MLPFINAETPGAAFPSPELPMCLHCWQHLPPAYVYGLLLRWACHGLVMAVKCRLEERFMSFRCRSSASTEPEPLRSLLSCHVHKGFARPEPVRSWLPGPAWADCRCACRQGRWAPFLPSAPGALLHGQRCGCSSAGCAVGGSGLGTPRPLSPCTWAVRVRFPGCPLGRSLEVSLSSAVWIASESPLGSLSDGLVGMAGVCFPVSTCHFQHRLYCCVSL